MSLYQKHRPDTFAKVKGNDNIIQSLENYVADMETCPHTFLFHGGTGTGKTTIARILARKLGCVGSDYKEIDNAQFRGIDSVRELIQNCQYAPMEGTCRVYTLDEIHKMTGDAQNALLKVLEDTPKHVYFILCTTEPEKLLATIKGRCQQYQVKTLGDDTMRALLKKIVRLEKKELDDEIYDQIILDSLGHPRNAINILEQTLSVTEEKRLEMAKQSAAIQTQGIELCRLLMKGGAWKPVASVLKGLKDQEPESIRRIIIGYFSAVLLNGDNARAGLILECFMEPNFTNGFPQLLFNCYEAMKN